MDSITQAALGAAIGQAMIGRFVGRKGAMIGAIVATIPDLDVILLPFLDPLQRLSMHRGFSHSIAFSIAFAMILLAVFKWWSETKAISSLRLYMFSWLTLITHMLLDAFTSYGTLLLLPFSDRRIGFDSINIVDPFYTGPLLIGLGICLFSRSDYKPKRYANMIGLVASTIYLCATVGIKHFVENDFRAALNADGIDVIDIMSQPVGIGSINWYGLGRTTEGFYMGHYSIFDQEFSDLSFFAANDVLLSGVDNETVRVMKWFAKDFYHVTSVGDSLFFYNMQVDMQGLYDVDGRIAPTRGFFVIEHKEGGRLIGSGRH